MCLEAREGGGCGGSCSARGKNDLPGEWFAWEGLGVGGN